MFLIVNRGMKSLKFLRSIEVKKLLLDLDFFGAVDLNGIFPLFFFL